MLPEKLLQADYLDIVFDNRNKAYGGYELRRSYAHRVRKSGAVALIVVAVLSSYSFIATRDGSNHKTPLHDTTVVHMQNIIEQIKPPVVPPPPLVRSPEPPKPIATRTFSEPRVVPNELVRPEQELTKNKDLRDVAIGNKNQDGDPGNLNPDIHSVGKGTGPAIVTPQPPSKIPTYVEQMPQFNGNLNEYLGTHLHYPEGARETNIQGKVILQFVVNEDGSVSSVTTVRSLGGGCDEEALRMLRGMPKWKPGKQNGVAVKVMLMLPIDFVLQ